MPALQGLRERLSSLLRRGDDEKYYEILRGVDGFDSYVKNVVTNAVRRSVELAKRHSYPKYESGLPHILVLRLGSGERTPEAYLRALERLGVKPEKVAVVRFTELLNVLDREVSRRLEKDGMMPTDAEVYRENKGTVKGGFSAGLSGAVPTVKAGAEAEVEEAVSARLRGDVDAVRTKVIETIGELVERLRKGRRLVVIMDADVEGDRRSFVARHLLETGNVTLVVDQDNIRVLRSITHAEWAREYSIGHSYFDSLDEAEDTVSRFARIVEAAIIRANKDALERAAQIIHELPDGMERKLSLNRQDVISKLKYKYVLVMRGQVIPAYAAALILENFSTEIVGVAATSSYGADIEPATLLSGLARVIYTAVLSKEELLRRGSYGAYLSAAVPLAVRRMREGNDHEHRVTRLLAVGMLRDSLRGADSASLSIVPAKDVVVYEDLGVVEGDATALAEKLADIAARGAGKYAGYLVVREWRDGRLLIGVLVGHKVLGTLEWDGRYFWLHVARVFDVGSFLAGASRVRVYGIRDPVQALQEGGRDKFSRTVIGIVKVIASNIFYPRGARKPDTINRRDILVSQVAAMAGVDERVAGLVVDALALRRVRLKPTISPEMVVRLARELGYEDVDVGKVVAAMVASGLAIPRTRYATRSAVVNYLTGGRYEEYIIARRTELEGVIPSGDVLEKFREYVREGVEMPPGDQRLLLYFSPVFSAGQLRGPQRSPA